MTNSQGTLEEIILFQTSDDFMKQIQNLVNPCNGRVPCGNEAVKMAHDQELAQVNKVGTESN